MTIQVIYIVGETRSGTTIVDRVLGSLEGVTSLCELALIWDEGYQHNNNCSCGTHFADCTFWQDVTKAAFDDDPVGAKVWELRDRLVRSRYFPQLFAGLYGREVKEALEAYRGWLGRLYFGLQETTGNSIFIDSSKSPAGPLILKGIPGIETHVLHLVRDPRGFVYSMQKGNYNPAYEGPMAVRSPLSCANGWLVRNVFCELLALRMPYVRLIYDRVMQHPRDELQRTVDQLAPLKGKSLAFLDERTIELGRLHSVAGNPHRFNAGPVKLKIDDEWRRKLDRKSRRLTTLLGYPLIKRYGL